MNSKRYSHLQIGWLVLIVVGAAMFLILYLMRTSGFYWVPLAVLVVLGICLILFSTLAVTGDGDSLEVRFGPGLIRKKFLFKDIGSCREVKNPWHYGWGIRYIPHGWLFNVSGFDALEIQMRNGKKYRIGTNDLRGLAEFVRGNITQDG